MYKVSKAYLDTVYKGHSRETTIRGKLTLNKTDIDGKAIIIDFTGEDIKLSTLCIDRAAVNSNDLNIGSVYAAHFTVDMLSKTDRYEIDRYSTYGGKITFTYSMKCIDNTIQDIPLGEYQITEGKRHGDYIRLGGYDKMLKLDELIEFPAESATWAGKPSILLMTMAYNQCGIEIGTPLAYIDTISPVDENGNIYSFSIPKNGQCRTCRDVVAKIGQLLGGFFYIDRDNRISFSKFTGDGTVDATVSDLYRRSADVYDFTCEYSGVSANTEDETIMYGDNSKLVLGLGDFPLDFETDLEGTTLKAAQLNVLKFIYDNSLKGVKYTPCTLDFAGDPAIDLGDAIKLTGRNCDPVNGTVLLVMASKWKYHGSHILNSYGKDQALSKVQQIKSNKFKGDVSKQVQTVIKEVGGGDTRTYYGDNAMKGRTVNLPQADKNIYSLYVKSKGGKKPKNIMLNGCLEVLNIRLTQPTPDKNPNKLVFYDLLLKDGTSGRTLMTASGNSSIVNSVVNIPFNVFKSELQNDFITFNLRIGLPFDETGEIKFTSKIDYNVSAQDADIYGTSF